ncbi:MAG: chemotaxis response regulator protein-glutamate methylesterase [Burkholderiales bacterium]|jgi:two-component system chemotaxis response regulator CheB|nr:chemotaxis response regulator protein-glutamate methylesterase [Burkholderiales bacterium]
MKDATGKIRVVVVDDSALVRSILSTLIDSQADMACIGVASDPLVAREMIRELNPDVITLDVEMPKMDGLDFLEKLMRLRPMPVVMVSTLTERGAETTLRALELGAVDFVAKPRLGLAQGLQEMAKEITEKVRIAAKVRIDRRAVARPAPPSAAPRSAGHGPSSADAAAPLVKAVPISYSRVSTEKLIAIGASTGGTEALREMLSGLPADCPAVMVTQHMPPGFTRSLADRLNSVCRMHVKEAEHGERILPGHVYIAPGGRHLAVRRSGANYVVEVNDAEVVNRHRPSVEVLFNSVANEVGRNAIGVMLTGMGRDGADAMLKMREAGAYNFAQDEASCVVFGMPREAIATGAVHEVLPLQKIAAQLLTQLRLAGPVLSRV